MLGCDLLRFRRINGSAKPSFVPTDDPHLLAAAAALLQVYKDGAAAGATRGELLEACEPVLSDGDPVLLKGLHKIILDRTDFAASADIDFPALRENWFTRAAALYTSTLPESELTFHTTIAAGEEMPRDLYADLPEFEQIERYREMTPRELLERYNVALVQGLLIHARNLELIVADPDSSKLRRIFKYLKFFRLLATITRYQGKAVHFSGQNALKLVINGPYSLFAETRKYGIQLASFFPAICALERYSLHAELIWKEKPLSLNLDESAGLISFYRNFSSYVPEEITMFHKLFKATDTAWKITGDTPFLKGNSGEIIFPDLAFEHTGTGKIYYLELFHRWHAGALTARLHFLQKQPKSLQNLLIGIDRAILAGTSPEDYLQKYPELKGRIFFFRNFPGVERVCKYLDQQIVTHV